MKIVIRENPQKGVVMLRMNRPEKHNALNIPLMEALKEEFDLADKDESVRVLLLKGEGESFCSGLDMCEVGDEECIEKSARALAYLLSAIYTSSLITISMVHGAVLGGGAGLMCASDFAIASEETKIGFPEVRRGLIAAQVMTFLVRSLDRSHISELVLLGENIGTKRAYEIGLVHSVVAKEKLDEKGIEYANKILLGAPKAVQETKRFSDVLYPASFSDDLYNALTHHHKVRHSSEAKEGIAAFREKRKPYWVQ